MWFFGWRWVIRLPMKSSAPPIIQPMPKAQGMRPRSPSPVVPLTQEDRKATHSPAPMSKPAEVARSLKLPLGLSRNQSTTMARPALTRQATRMGWAKVRIRSVDGEDEPISTAARAHPARAQ